MNSFIAVFKRELKSYFTTPIAYVFLVIFLMVAGGWPLYKQNFFQARQAELTLFFRNLPLLFAFMSPCIAMRLWAEERKSGTVELLFSLPITVTQAAWAKFLAAWLFLLIAILLTITMPITVIYLGSPDIGLIVTGYLASFLLAGAFLAIGCFFSALTKNQIISFILSVVVLLLFYYASMPSTLNFFSGFVSPGFLDVIEGMSLLNHFESMQKGLIRLSDILYFTILIIGWIIASIAVLDERKAA